MLVKKYPSLDYRRKPILPNGTDKYGLEPQKTLQLLPHRHAPMDSSVRKAAPEQGRKRRLIKKTAEGNSLCRCRRQPPSCSERTG